MKAVTFLLALLLSASAAALPTEIEAEYLISTSGLTIGRVSERYQRSGDTYRIESTTRAEGLLKLFRDETVVLQSEGRVGRDGLQPLRFAQRRSTDASRDIVATFDWAQAKLHSTYRGEETAQALPAGTQDRLSILYQFMNMSPAGNEVRLHMSNGRKVERYAYRKVDEPTLATPAGEFATVHYERIIEDSSEARAQLWLARDRYHLAVRILFEDARGLRLEQSLVSLATR